MKVAWLALVIAVVALVLAVTVALVALGPCVPPQDWTPGMYVGPC